MCLPVVRGAAQRGAELRVALVAAAAQQRHHHAVDHPERIQQLLAHQREVGARMAAVLRPGVHPHAGPRRHPGVVRRADERRAAPRTDRLPQGPPAFRQERIEFGARLHVGVHVAIHEAETALRGGVGPAFDDGYVHRGTPRVIGSGVIGSGGSRWRARCPPGSCGRGLRVAHRAWHRCPRSASADNPRRTAASPRSRSPR